MDYPVTLLTLPRSRRIVRSEPLVDPDEFDDELDEDAQAILAAIDEYITGEPDSIERAYNPNELRIPGGKGGGRWTAGGIGGAILHALEAWGKGEGPDDPFTSPLDPKLAREVEVENKIRAAYRDLARNPGSHVMLADLREHADVPRAEFDAALVRMSHEGGQFATVHLAPQEDQKRLTPRLRDASIRHGDENMHMVSFEDPSARPLPTGKPIDREPLRKAAVARGIELKRGATRPEIVAALKDHIKGAVKTQREASTARKSSAKFSITHGGKRIDVAVYTDEATGKKAILRVESDTGKPGRAITTQPDLAGLEKWANAHGHTDIADWAAKERGSAPLIGNTTLKATPTRGFDARVKAARKGTAATAATVYRFTGASTANADMFPERAERVAVSDAFASYRGIGSSRLNRKIRAGDLTDGRIAQMDKAFAQSPLESDVVTYRGVRTGGSVFGAEMPANLTGFEWTDRAYFSTSVDRAVAEPFAHDGGVLMRIVAPMGIHAVGLRPASRVEKPEYEILFDRGLTYRVVADHGVVDGRRHLDVEVVPASKERGGEKAAAPKTAPAKAAKKAAPKLAPTSPAEILATLPDGLTPGQKRARLRSRGVPAEQIDALVPLASAKKAAPAAKAAKAAGTKATPYVLAPDLRGPTARKRHLERDEALVALSKSPDGLAAMGGALYETFQVLEHHGYVRDDGRKFRLTDKGREYIAARGTTESSAKPLSGHDALAAPPHNLEALTAAGDPRADALWYRTGDNSMETASGIPGSFEMSEQMRAGGARMTPETKARVKDISSVMKESVLTAPIEVYRGFEADKLGEPGRRVGKQFTDKAFVSATTDTRHASQFGGTVMRIRVPAGTSAIRTADRPGSRYENESEILLNRGLRFRVVAEHPRGRIPGFGGAHVIDVEIVQ